MQREMIFKIAEKFDGIVVVDEAYIDFAKEPSFTAELALTPNLVILQTFSKAWGMAGVRVGLAFASKGIIDLMNRVKPPYNVSGIAQRTVLEALNDFARVDRWIELAVQQRAVLADSLNRFACVEKIYPSDANFVLVKVVDANSVYKFLLDEGIVVRNRNNVELCHGCLRVTVGTAEENTRLTAALSKYSESKED